MASRIVAAALLSASAAAEMQCVGRLAHEVLSSPETGDFSIRPVPARDQECFVAWPALSGDHVFCIGVNEDGACDGAANPAMELPGETQCKDCFVAAKTDLWYDFNVSGFQLNKVGFGFRDVTVVNKLELAHDGVSKAHQWQSKTFFPNEKVLKHSSLPTVSLRMPTTISYRLSDDLRQIEGVGASLKITIPSISVQYVHGEGLTHSSDKPQLSLEPLMDGGGLGNTGDIDLQVKSDMEVTLESVWVNATSKASFSSTIPLVNTATVDLHSVKDCLSLGLDFDLTHESEVGLKLLSLSKQFKVGPTTLKRDNPKMVEKCFEKAGPAQAQRQSAVVV